MEKLCVFCKHFGWEQIGYIYYSTLTGGSLEGGAFCTKGKFSEYQARACADESEFRALILTAEKCDDYELA